MSGSDGEAGVRMQGGEAEMRMQGGEAGIKMQGTGETEWEGCGRERVCCC